MPYTPVPVGNQFIRNFPVPLDRDFVFATTSARDSYLIDSATSGIAYTGMIVADLETNKAYLLDTNRQWVQVGQNLNEVFGASNSGILIKTGDNTFTVGGLGEGSNIDITNASGLAGNPTISLDPIVTGLTSLEISGTGADALTVSGDATFAGNVTIASLDLTSTATILATGPIVFSGNPTYFDGDVRFTNTPTVGASGSDIPVSLSGHQHTYSDITNFCSGVDSCLTTSLTANSGVQLVYNGTNNLDIRLSGEALAQHKLSSTGFIARSGTETYVTRTIASGNNIQVTNGDGLAGNPTITLASAVSGLTSLEVTGTGVKFSALSAGTDDTVIVLGSDGYLKTDEIDNRVWGSSLVDGTGSGGHIAFWSDSDTITYDNNELYWDSSNHRLGIGTNNPGQSLHINGTNQSNSQLRVGFLEFQSYAINNGWIGENIYFDGSDFVRRSTGEAGLFYFQGKEGQFRFFDSGSAGSSTSNSAVWKINANGAMGVGSGLSTSSNSFTNAKFLITSDGKVGIGQTSPGSTLDVSGGGNFTGNLIVGGNLTVNGTTVTANVSTMEVKDPIITLGLASGNIVTDTNHDRGLALVVATGTTAFMGWDSDASQFVVLSSGSTSDSGNTYTGTYGSFKAGTLEASGLVKGSTLESTVSSPTAPMTIASTGTVSNLSADYLDGQHGSHYLDWDNFANIPDPTVSVSLTGDLSGSASTTWTNLSGNLNLSIDATIQANSVALGTDTTGNYVGSVSVSGTGLSISNTGAEGGVFTVASNATPASVTGTIVSRDSSGNFSAGTITANLIGNASTVTNGVYTNTTQTITGAKTFTTNNVTISGVSLVVGAVGTTITAPSGLIDIQYETSITAFRVDNTTNTTLFQIGNEAEGNDSISIISEDDITITADNIKMYGVINGTATWGASTITVPYGGTGATSLSGVVIGAGTTALTGLAATSAYQILRRNSANNAYEFSNVIDGGSP